MSASQAIAASSTVAAVFADFDHTFLGRPSQLLTPVAGRSILHRTLDRLSRVEGLDARCLFVTAAHESRAREFLGETGLGGIDVLPLDSGQRPRRDLLRAARKWNLESWRGHLCSATWFDEYVEPFCVAQVLDHYRCDAVLCLAGHQPLLDPAIATAMIVYKKNLADQLRMVFTQAPPGLAGIILRREMTRELLEHNLPIGIMLGYRPEMPQGDAITRVNCLQLPAIVAQTQARLTGDTLRSREILEAAIQDLGESASAEELCHRVRTNPGPISVNLPGDMGRPLHARASRAGNLPVEIELELTTNDPLPETSLRLRGSRVPKRHLDNVAHIGALARQLAHYDDRLIHLAGFGDPLLHPEFPQICASIREAGICGLSIATPLVELTDENLAALFDNRIDILQILLDANSAATYAAVHGADNFDRVIGNIQRVQDLRVQRSSPYPLIVPALTRCAATLPEMEAFSDRWIRTTGSAIIDGHNSFAGRLPPDSILGLTPPIRQPCRRLASRLTLLADGSAVLCAQDSHAQTRLGDWRSEPLPAIWRGTRLDAIRAAHQHLTISELPLCPGCDQWFRP